MLTFAVVLSTGRTPSLVPGHPLIAISTAASYLAAGAFAWWRIRKMGGALRPLLRTDVRVILIGTSALILVRAALVVQLLATHQTKHVQSGFEKFDVVSKVPTLTAISIVLTAATLVVVGPVVEEILFRGLLFGALAPRIGVIAGAIISAVLFGAVHGDPVLFPTLAALGLVAALAYAATGNLLVPIVLHALNNALGALFLITGSLNHHG